MITSDAGLLNVAHIIAPAYEALLKDTDKKVITLKDDIAENLAAIGAYKIMVQ